MRVTRGKAAEYRERIIDAAGALFRSKGFGGVGGANIVKAAGDRALMLLTGLAWTT